MRTCFYFMLFLCFLFAAYPLHMYYNAPPSCAAKLTSLWSLKADCFLIGGVPEVVVVMVTCEGYLDGLAGGGWVTAGGGAAVHENRGLLSSKA